MAVAELELTVTRENQLALSVEYWSSAFVCVPHVPDTDQENSIRPLPSCVVLRGAVAETVNGCGFCTAKLPLAVRPKGSETETETLRLLPVCPAVSYQLAGGVFVNVSLVTVSVPKVVEPDRYVSVRLWPRRFEKSIWTLFPRMTVLGEMETVRAGNVTFADIDVSLLT